MLRKRLSTVVDRVPRNSKIINDEICMSTFMRGYAGGHDKICH